MTQATCTHQKHAQGRMMVTQRRPCNETQWGDRKTTRHAYERNDEIEADYIIKNIVH